MIIGTDKDGLVKYTCFRGTNKNEGGFHSKLIPHSSAHNCSPDFAASLLADSIHRHNLNMAMMHLIDQIQIGFYDTWLIDQLQSVTAAIYGEENQLYPSWINSDSFRPTNESFGIVPVDGAKYGIEPFDANNDQLLFLKNLFKDNDEDDDNQHAVNRDSEIEPIIRTMKTLQYIAKRQNTKYAITPVTTIEEKTLFYHFATTKSGSNYDGQFFNSTTIAWNEQRANGTKIFYKLPAHLVTYKTKKFDRNRNMKKSTKELVPFKDNTAYNVNNSKNMNLVDPQIVPRIPNLPTLKKPVTVPILTVNRQSAHNFLPLIAPKSLFHLRVDPVRLPSISSASSNSPQPRIPAAITEKANGNPSSSITYEKRSQSKLNEVSQKTPKRCRKCFDAGRNDYMMKCRGKGGIKLCDADIIRCGACDTQDCPSKFNPTNCQSQKISPYPKKIKKSNQ